MTNNGFLNVREFGDRVGLSDAQVYRRIHTGRLSASRVVSNGKEQYAIPLDAVQEYLDSGGVGPEQAEGATLRVPEVARRLSYSPERVRQMVRDGVLEGRRNGERGRITIPRESVERFLSGDSAA